MKRQNAYFTVEAALVLPIVISAMLLISYLFCFQYDRCLLEQDMGALALWSSVAASGYAEGAGDLDQLLRQRAAGIYQGKYVAWENTNVEIRLEKDQVSVSGSGELTFPVPEWNLWNDDNFWKAATSFQNSRRSPVFYIRQYRKLEGLLDSQNSRGEDGMGQKEKE